MRVLNKIRALTQNGRYTSQGSDGEGTREVNWAKHDAIRLQFPFNCLALFAATEGALLEGRCSI